ncbi:sal-like protein 1 [Patiria miniata]|uniref:Homeotic protein spalt-major n=1 Tax=Patiria miniata TaxID=46514 RepID=A0A914BJH0_PATMI|nr:sal-like protein 1 [Patiria miniata]
MAKEEYLSEIVTYDLFTSFHSDAGAAKESHLNAANTEETDEDVIIGGVHVCGKCRGEFTVSSDFLQHKQTCSKKPVVVVINNDGQPQAESTNSSRPPSAQNQYGQEITKTVYHNNNDQALNGLQQLQDSQYDDQEEIEEPSVTEESEAHLTQEDGPQDHQQHQPSLDNGMHEEDIKASNSDRLRTQSVDSMEYEESHSLLKQHCENSRSPSSRPVFPGSLENAPFPMGPFPRPPHNRPEMASIQDQLFHLQQQHIHQLQLIQSIQQQLQNLAMQIKNTPATTSANTPVTTTSAPLTPSVESQPQLMSQPTSSSGPSPQLMHPFDSLPRPLPQQMMPSLPLRPSIIPPVSFPMPSPRPPFNMLHQQGVMPPVSSQLLQAPPRLPFPPAMMLQRKGKPPNVAVFDPKFPSDDPFFRHKCRFCHKVFGSDSALQIHIRSHTGERPFKCNICGNRFSTKGNLKVHFQRHVDRYPHVKMDTTPHPPSPPLPNERLPIQSPSIQQVPLPTIPGEMGRLPNDVPTSFHPGIPMSQASGSDSASSSISGDQPLEQQSQEEMCPKSVPDIVLPKSESESKTSDADAVVSPQLSQERSPAFSSAPMTSSFAHSISQIMSESSCTFTTAPIATSKTETPSSLAALAEQGFRPSETSKLQMLVENIEQKISDSSQCVICHRVLSCKSALQMHYRIHTGERPYKCRVCLRSFTTKGNLKTHYSVHRAQPPLRMFHDCPICQKRFSNVLVLQQHLRMHAAEGFQIPQDLSAFEHYAEDKFVEELVCDENQGLDQDDDDEDARLNEMASQMESSPEGFSEPEGAEGELPNGLPVDSGNLKQIKSASEQDKGLTQKIHRDLMDRARGIERVMDVSKEMRMDWMGKEVEESSGVPPTGESTSPPAYLTDDSSLAASPSSEPQPNYTKGIDSIASALHLQASNNAENHHRQLISRLPNPDPQSPSEKSQEGSLVSDQASQSPDDHNDDQRLSQEDVRRHEDEINRHGSIQRSHSSEPRGHSDDLNLQPNYIKNHHDELRRHRDEMGSQHGDSRRHPGSTYQNELQGKQDDKSHAGDSEQISDNECISRNVEPRGATDEHRGEHRHIFDEHKSHPDNLKFHQDDLHRAPLKIDTSRMDNNGALDLTPKSVSSGSSENSLEALKNQVNNSHYLFPMGFPHPGDGRLNGSSAGLLMPDPSNTSYGSRRSNGSSTTCHYCGKSFACSSALNIHYRSHTKERPYKCEICSKGFSTRGNLRQHMLTHKIRDMPTQILDPSHPHYKHQQQQQMMHPMHHLQSPPHSMLMPGMPNFAAEMAMHQYHQQQQQQQQRTSPRPFIQRDPPPSHPERQRSPQTHQQQLPSPLGSPQKISPLNPQRPASPFDDTQEIPLSSQMKSPSSQQSTPPSSQNHLTPSSQLQQQQQQQQQHQQQHQQHHSPNNNNKYQPDIHQKLYPSLQKPHPTDLPIPPSQPSLKRSISESSCPSPPKRLRHSCHVCGKQFQSDSALQIHIRTHTGEKPFKCHICGRAFTTKGNLKVHLGTHMWNGGPTRRGRRISMEAPLMRSPKEGEMFRPDMFGLRPMYEGAFFQYPPPIMNGFAAAMSKANEISVIQNHHSSIGHTRIPEGSNSVIMKSRELGHDSRDQIPESVASQN